MLIAPGLGVTSVFFLRLPFPYDDVHMIHTGKCHWKYHRRKYFKSVLEEVTKILKLSFSLWLLISVPFHSSCRRKCKWEIILYLLAWQGLADKIKSNEVRTCSIARHVGSRRIQFLSREQPKLLKGFCFLSLLWCKTEWFNQNDEFLTMWLNAIFK
jgi:hypothetical protein